jgi:hypothetical protein
MINADIPFELRQIIEFASYIDTSAAKWLEQRSEVMAVYGKRPVAVEDTVVVPAKNAWSRYGECRAYVCQAGRAFRAIERMAFYGDREIKCDIPAVVHRRDNVEWTPEESARLRASGDRFDRKIANVIDIASWVPHYRTTASGGVAPSYSDNDIFSPCPLRPQRQRPIFSG